MKNLNTLQSRHVPIFKGNVSLVRNHQEAMSSFLNKFPEGIVLNPQLRKQIAMAIQEADLPISIEGETGTGKEQIVKYIHAQIHAQQPGPLVIINCANLKKDLASATLFGHKKGAFTGAIENCLGAIGKADGGMLFLDEFHRLEPSIQEQILRTMQDGSYQRIGDHAESFSQFRLVIATPKSLEQHTLDGQILMDLRFRLYGIEIRIPPLRERLHQMADFIDYFVASSDRKIVLSALQRDALIQRCCEFHWQGNIRQLFGVLRILVIQSAADGKPMDAADLPIYPTMLPPFSLGTEKPYTDRTGSLHETMSAYPKDAIDDLLTLVRRYTEQPTHYESFIAHFENLLLAELAERYPNVKSLCEAISLPRSTYHAKRKRLKVNPSGAHLEAQSGL